MSSYEQERDREPAPRRRRVPRALAAAGLTFATVSLGLIAPGPASADAQAWSCPARNVCVYRVTNGQGDPCNWSNADPDWWRGSTRCSWSETQNVRSAINRGTSSAYTAVAFYSGANYSGDLVGCLHQNGERDGDANVRVRSHKWVTAC